MQIPIPPEIQNSRLDAWIAQNQPSLSRAYWQKLIKDGAVLVNGVAQTKCGYLLKGGEELTINQPEPEPTDQKAEDIPLAILYEDSDIIVINKPPNLVVHPAAGHSNGTLVNALLFHCKDLAGINGDLRPGIVHRLDKDTSGVLVVAKNDQALLALVKQFQERSLHKEYLAIVHGRPEPASGKIETLIGRSQRDRKKMAVVTNNRFYDEDDDDEASPRGREAITRYQTVEKLAKATLVKLVIETGRTHQIRVHMAHYGHPVLGDTTYGKVVRLGEITFPRQMLHAARLVFSHPRTGQELDIRAPLPEDMEKVLAELR